MTNRIILGLILALLTLPAQGAVIYDWEGICESGCSGTANAVITFTDDYTPGDFVDWTNIELFDSFEYVSNNLSFSITTDTVGGLGEAFMFNTRTGSLTQITSDNLGGFPFLAYAQFFGMEPFWRAAEVFNEDSGTIYSLTLREVPGPAAIWLFGTALIGLLGFSKRKKTA